MLVLFSLGSHACGAYSSSLAPYRQAGNAWTLPCKPDEVGASGAADDGEVSKCLSRAGAGSNVGVRVGRVGLGGHKGGGRREGHHRMGGPFGALSFTAPLIPPASVRRVTIPSPATWEGSSRSAPISLSGSSLSECADRAQSCSSTGILSKAGDSGHAVNAQGCLLVLEVASRNWVQVALGSRLW